MLRKIDLNNFNDYTFYLKSCDLDIIFIKPGKVSFSSVEYDDNVIDINNNTFIEKNINNINNNKLKITLCAENINLFIKTFSGDISIKNGIINKCVIDTKSGDLNLKNSNFTHSIASSYSGNILIEECNNINSIKTISGDISINNSYFKNLYLNTTSGDIYLKNNICETSLEANSISGNIDSINCDYESRNINFKTITGKINIVKNKGSK